MSSTPCSKLAVLIDADNAQATLCPQLFAAIGPLGRTCIRRAYGDWTSPHLAGWKKHLQQWDVRPVQQFRQVGRKNATDAALIIDAMDLLHTADLDGFCLVSSDSDFTRLASRIREGGRLVYGFGKRDTPRAFVAACDRFVDVGSLHEALPASPAGADPGVDSPASTAGDTEPLADVPFLAWLQDAIRSGREPINTAKARMHVIPEGLLLVSPGIFKDYSLQEWAKAQKRFLKLRLHTLRPDGTNIWTATVSKDGRRRHPLLLKGILIANPEQRLQVTLPGINPVLTLLK